ncbi:MAG: cyclic nucleotide-binding domain-containing protein [Candidatus Wallbacteria bacterium]|nr:cyclic nucleotide-binding domain-containing protein [Candidatus Wallbacteria bacterium]
MKQNSTFERVLENPSHRQLLLELLRGVWMFQLNDPEDLMRILSASQHVLYSPGERIFEQNSQSRDLHLILAGEVFICLHHRSGTQEILTRIGPGSVFGELAFVAGGRRSAHVLAGMGGSENLRLAWEDFARVLAQRPEVVSATMTGVLKEIQRRSRLLPKDLAEFAVWGYEHPHEASSPQRQRVFRPLAGWVSTGLALLAAWGGWKLGGDLSAHLPAAGGDLTRLQTTASGYAALAGSVLGGILGMVADRLRLSTAELRSNARSCLNCKYVHWDEKGPAHCLLEAGLGRRKVTSSLVHGAFTACPNFHGGRRRKLQSAPLAP